MDFETARDFLRRHHRGVLVTYRQDGHPQMSPVLASVDHEGYVIISTRATAYKVRNIRRNSAVYICVFVDAFFGRWIQIDGQATIIPLPQAMDALIAYYRSIAGEHPNWREYRATMKQEQRVLLRIEIERVGPTHEG